MLSTNINLTFSQFVVKVRALFLAEFANHKELFPGVDGEAMFVGTVLHSLDHVSHFIQSLLHHKMDFSHTDILLLQTLMDWNLKDALYLDTSDPRFGKMAEVGQIVKVGL